MTFVKDPCGLVCVLFTYLAIFYADYVVTRWIIVVTLKDSLWGPVHVIIYNTIIFLLSMAHLKAVLSDPGTVPLPQSRLDFSDLHSNNQNGKNQEEWTVCTRCETYRPPKAHHCRICNRCIRRMDHHCPWINNCVGERNQKYFLQFLIYVGFLSVYSIILVLISWATPCETCLSDIPENQARMLHSVLLLLEGILFGLFVIAIMVDQLQAIFCDESPIEALQLKGMYNRTTYHPKILLLSNVFGKSHPMLWIFPCNGNTSKKYDTPLLNHDV